MIPEVNGVVGLLLAHHLLQVLLLKLDVPYVQLLGRPHTLHHYLLLLQKHLRRYLLILLLAAVFYTNTIAFNILCGRHLLGFEVNDDGEAADFFVVWVVKGNVLL